MKARQFLIVIVTILFFLIHSGQAQSFKVKNFKATVKGSSSLHEWESVIGKLECKCSFKIENNVLIDIKDAEVKVPVKSIKSAKGRMMDSKTYDAFNYEKYPSIIFILNSKKINASTQTAALTGTLTMAGAAKQIDLVANYKVHPNGDLQIIVAKKIKMTEFKMEPPTAMMGTIKVADEVTISFDLVFSSTNTIL